MFWNRENKIIRDEEAINSFLSRGVEAIFPSKDILKDKMLKGEALTFYYGIDPTGPNIHIGHLIPIRKLAELQKLGHKIIFLIGDFTAKIGDPDKKSVRKPLSTKEILDNLKNYKKQVSRFIDFKGRNKALFKFNSSWLSKMTFEEVLFLSSKVTVDQMLKRDMFKKRIEEEKPIYLHEFMYPLMQGYDSVAMDVDGEMGGNDQTFNMLVGRDLLKIYKNKEKFVIATKLLTDSLGNKMGKSEGNMIDLGQKPEDMFGRIMSWPDSMIVDSFNILTDLPLDKIESIKNDILSLKNPRDFKILLAKEVVSMCFGERDAQKALESFEKVFTKKEMPEDILEIKASGRNLQNILVHEGLVSSNTEYRRLINEGAIVFVKTGEKIKKDFALKEGEYKIGKKRFVRIL